MSSEIQAVLFSKDSKYEWNTPKIKEFLDKNKLTQIKPTHETTNYYRCRINPPEKYKYFRTHKVKGMGIDFVIGFGRR